MTRLVLAIATVPDTDAGRAIYQLGDLSDDGICKAMAHLNNQQTGTHQLPFYQQRIIAFSALVKSDSGEINLVSFQSEDEVELLTKLAVLIEDASELVSWSGDNFDRPVLAFRYLKYGIACPAVFDQFSIDSIVHTTLSSELPGLYECENLLLSTLAVVLGLPVASGLETIDVLESYQQGEWDKIAEACDADALNSYLLGQRLWLTKGELNNSEYQQDCDTLHTYLGESNKAHLNQFATNWLPNNNK